MGLEGGVMVVLGFLPGRGLGSKKVPRVLYRLTIILAVESLILSLLEALPIE